MIFSLIVSRDGCSTIWTIPIVGSSLAGASVSAPVPPQPVNARVNIIITAKTAADFFFIFLSSSFFFKLSLKRVSLHFFRNLPYKKKHLSYVQGQVLTCGTTLFNRL